MSAPKEPAMTPDAEIPIEMACDLAENLVTKFAQPLIRLRDVARVVKDSKNMLAVYAREIPALEGRLAALTIEEAAATALAANARARSDEAIKTSDQLIRDAGARTGAAQESAVAQLADVERAVATRRAALEAAYTARAETLEGLLATEQQKLDAVTAEYAALVATIRAKFGTS